MDIATRMREVGVAARAAARHMSAASTAQKNCALEAAARAIDESREHLIAANLEDLEQARKKDLEAALLDRLELSPERIDAMIESLRQVAALPDPVGVIDNLSPRPSGIQVGRMRAPLGVVGMIYESRPNVTSEAASLALKSGNAIVLRGGSEALKSNMSIASCMVRGLREAKLPERAVQLLDFTDRKAVDLLVQMPEHVDVIVPRGGKALIERISQAAQVPVIKHLDGVCHVYIDGRCDERKALAIAVNAKTQRYGVCNAMETLLVDEVVAEILLPKLAEAFVKHQVELRVCPRARDLLAGFDTVDALEDDWHAEYLAAKLAVRVVDGLDEAIAHIAEYGSQHTESIVTEDFDRARRFLREVDSSSVMVNASTRFADGFEYGLGAEVGISTDKFHARGPVGLEGLTSQKFVVLGNGEVRV